VRVSKVVVGADLLEEHVRGRRAPSVLRVAMGRFLCYTTVFSVIEAFARAADGRERLAMMDTVGALKVLGLNAKNALRYAGLFRRHPSVGSLDLLVAGLCCESRLPLLTRKVAAFRRIQGLEVLRPEDIMGARRGATLARPSRSRK